MNRLDFLQRLKYNIDKPLKASRVDYHISNYHTHLVSDLVDNLASYFRYDLRSDLDNNLGDYLVSCLLGNYWY